MNEPYLDRKMSVYIYKGYLFKMLLYSLDIIMWTKVWRIAYSCIKSFSVQCPNFLWNDWIKETKPLTSLGILLLSCYLMESLMKNDFILNTFTLDVSQAHLHMSDDIEMYKAFIVSQYQ